MTKQLEYRLQDGTRVPLFEADYDISFEVKRKDLRGAIIGDPLCCIEAKALCRLNGVVEAYVGGGKDAYVVFKATRSRPFKHALHFTIPADAARVRDAFDTDKKLASRQLMMRAITSGRTMEHRRELNRRRQQEIEAGAPIRRHSSPRKQRITKLGVPRRPQAKIVRNVVSLYDENGVANVA